MKIASDSLSLTKRKTLYYLRAIRGMDIERLENYITYLEFKQVLLT